MKLPLLSRRLVLLVLSLYLATLGVAIASPFADHRLLGHCAVSVSNMVDQETGSDANGLHLLDCQLCATCGAAPLAETGKLAQPPHALSYAVRAGAPAHTVTTAAAPLPARGPPASPP